LKYQAQICVLGLVTAVITGPVLAGDGPFFQPPHALLQVEVDAGGKVFTQHGIADFSDANITFNALGNTILKHNVGGTSFSGGGFKIYPGGIAERDGNNPLNPATAASTKLLADDPGFFVDGGILPANYTLRVNFFNSLRYFAPGGSAWTAPISGEQLRVFDLENDDDAGGPTGDLQLLINGGTSGLLGTINIDNTDPLPAPLFSSGVHGHLGYELSRPSDNGVPAVGAYMMELTLSIVPTPGNTGGPVFRDSDPIFVVFNNQLSSTNFGLAVTAAEALPEPSTATLVVASGLALLGLRRRGA